MSERPDTHVADDLHERHLAGALLIGERNGIIAADHLGELETVDVRIERYRLIVQTALNRRDAGLPVDCPSIAEDLDRAGRITPAWPNVTECVNDLLAIMADAPEIWHVPYWSACVQGAARKRRMSDRTRELTRALSSPSIDSERIAELSDEISKLARAGSQNKIRQTTLQDAAKRYLERLQSSDGELLSTGIADLDEALGGGVEPGEMFLLCGRPSHGKSAVALQVLHHRTGQGDPCAMISEEMSAARLGKRAAQFASDVHQEHWQVRAERVEHDLDVHFHDRAPCFIVEQCRTAAAACHEIRRLVKDHGVKCVAVDYAQLLSSPGKTRYEQVTATSIALRQVTNETGILLVALCQLNRSIEDRSPMIPTMADIKDSGQLEQDADVVVFQIWPHRVDSSNDPSVYQFFVGKNRNREIRETAIECRFEPSRQRITGKVFKPEPDYAKGWQ